MKNLDKYINFVNKNGISLNLINPGSSEIALNKEDAIIALNYLYEAEIAIFGGDIVSIIDGCISYANVNWSCDKNDEESDLEFAKLSIKETENYIKKFNPIGEWKPFFVFVF